MTASLSWSNTNVHQIDVTQWLLLIEWDSYHCTTTAQACSISQQHRSWSEGLPRGIHLKIQIIMGYNSLNKDSVDCKGCLYYMTAVGCRLKPEIWAWVIATWTQVIYVTVLMTSITWNIYYSGGNLEFKDLIHDVTWGGIVNDLPKLNLYYSKFNNISVFKTSNNGIISISFMFSDMWAHAGNGIFIIG